MPSKVIVDVGANSAQGSNSYDLLRHFGWHGILIEANPDLHDRIRDDFRGLSYRLINAAISNYNGTATFFISTGNEASSLHGDVVADTGSILRTATVPVRRLPDVLAESDVPKEFGILSIDTEGEDLNILNDTISSDYRPEWVIFEAHLASQQTSLYDLDISDVIRNNYEMMGSTYANIFLKRKK